LAIENLCFSKGKRPSKNMRAYRGGKGGGDGGVE